MFRCIFLGHWQLLLFLKLRKFTFFFFMQQVIKHLVANTETFLLPSNIYNNNNNCYNSNNYNNIYNCSFWSAFLNSERHLVANNNTLFFLCSFLQTCRTFFFHFIRSIFLRKINNNDYIRKDWFSTFVIALYVSNPAPSGGEHKIFSNFFFPSLHLPSVSIYFQYDYSWLWHMLLLLLLLPCTLWSRAIQYSTAPQPCLTFWASDRNRSRFVLNWTSAEFFRNSATFSCSQPASLCGPRAAEGFSWSFIDSLLRFRFLFFSDMITENLLTSETKRTREICLKKKKRRRKVRTCMS